MVKEKHLGDIEVLRVITANEPRHYQYLVNCSYASGESYVHLVKAIKDSKSSEKYKKISRAFFEIETVRGILDQFRLQDGIGLVRSAWKEGKKPHISVALLEPEDRTEIKIPIPYQELEELVKDFVLDLACQDFKLGDCINNCPYSMQWNKFENCYKVNRTAYRVLRKYAGNDKAFESHKKIMEK